MAARDEVVARMTAPASRVQLIRGPGGIGKTTLATAIAEVLAADGLEVLPVIALRELSAIPLAAMAPTLTRLGGENTATIADRVQQLYASIATRADSYVLLIDDGPLLDDVSASMIYQLVRVAGVRCLVTARTEHEISGPLARVLADDLSEVLELDGISSAAANRLVENALGGAVDPASLRRLVATADGNPLFLRELLTASVEHGSVSPGERGLQIDDTALPRQLRDGISQRFQELPAAARSLAQLVAVAEPWPAEQLGEHDLVARLIDLGLVRRSPDNDVRLSHPLFAEVLLAEMTASQIEERRIEAARRSDTGTEDTQRFRIDVLLAETRSPPGGDELVWAAQYASSLGDHPLALHLATLALSQRRSFDALLVRATALSAMKHSDAARALAEAREDAKSDRDVALVARERARHEAITLERPRVAITNETDELARVTDREARRLMELDIARWRLIAGQGPFPEPIPVDVASADPLAHLVSTLYEVIYSAQTNDFVRSRAAIERARPLAERERLSFPTARSILDLFEYREITYRRGLDVGREYALRERREGPTDWAGMWTNELALIDVYAGRVEEGLELANEAVDQLGWRDVSGGLAEARGTRATASAQLGMRTVAREYLRTEPSGDVKEMLQRAEVGAWLRSADPAAGAQLIRAAGERAMQANAHAIAAPTLYTAVRLGRASLVLPLYREIGRTEHGLFIASMIQHAEAADASDADALVAASAPLLEAGLIAGAVDAAFEASQLFRRAGKGEKERKALLFIAAHGGGLSGYRRDRRLRGSLELSEREWSVALAASGRARSREIGERLGLSTRTIENHLANVYRKLGVAGRDQLREVLEQFPDR